MFSRRQSTAAAVDVCPLLADSNPYRLVARASRCGRQQKSPPKGFSGAQKAFNLAAFLGATVLRCELVFCNFGEWWRGVLHLGMCLATRGNLTSIELAVCRDFATEGVTAWQIMIWEQAQDGDRVGKTRFRLQR